MRHMKGLLPDERTVHRLRCPLCQSQMTVQLPANGQGSVRLTCTGARAHSYDFSSSGHVNLLQAAQSGGGDSKQAVRARSEFLNLELYRPVADALCDTLCRYLPDKNRLVIDAGCGEGYYTARIAAEGFSVAGADLSKFAVEAAARRAARQGISHGLFAAASVFSLPFVDSAADAVVNVFAPCAETEFSRVLAPNGILVVVYAGREHLMGLKQALYETTKENDGRADLPQGLTLVEERQIRYDVTVCGRENLQNLFAMTPYYWRTSPADSEKLTLIDELTTPVDVMIAVYRKS